MTEFPEPNDSGELWIRLDTYFTVDHTLIYGGVEIAMPALRNYDVCSQIKYLVTQAMNSAEYKYTKWNAGNSICDYGKAEMQMQKNLSLLRRKIIAPVYAEMGLSVVKRIIPCYLMNGKFVKINADNMPKLYNMGIGIDPDDLARSDFESALCTDLTNMSKVHWTGKTTLADALNVSAEIDRCPYDKKIPPDLWFTVWRLALTHDSIQYFYHS